MATAIGIDLGTTYSCVGMFRYGTVEIIANDQGHRTTPSYVAFNESGRLIGDAAKAQVASNASNTVFDAKRLLGRKFEDEIVQEDMKHFPFKIVDENGKLNIEVQYRGQTRQICPEEISAMIIGKLKETAEAYLGTKVTDAVITVPAYFNDAQRQATKDAGAIAGLNVLRIINEPTAAAIAYGLDKRAQGEKNVLVFDLGGGTFDVSILCIDDGVFEVKSTSGDTHLGGEDFDNQLVGYCVHEFRRRHQTDISGNKSALRRLRTECENAKRALSASTQASIDVPNLHDGIDFSFSITRAKFEEICLDLFKSTLKTVEKALEGASLKKTEIDEIVLVGGSTHIPKIQRLLQDFFGGKELNKSINPDEAVAYGAAVQAAILTGDESEDLQELLLLDIIPLSLGLEEIGGLMVPLIKANTTIPTTAIDYFTTTSDNQSTVRFKVYEGERKLTKDNHLLGQFLLESIPPALRGVPQIEVTFTIDVNGILTVTAVERQGEIENHISISSDSGRLSEEDIQRMKRQAQLYCEEDNRERSRIVAWNALDHYIYQIRSALKQTEVRTKISDNEHGAASAKADEVVQWMQSVTQVTQDEIQQKHDQLTDICSPIMDKIFG